MANEQQLDLAPELEGTERIYPGRPGAEQADGIDQPAGAPRLLVVNADGACSVITLPRAGVITIGRDPLADVRLEERAASRRHAQLELDEHGRIWLSDLGSINGTLLGGEPVRGARVPVAAGELIEIGRSSITVQRPAMGGEARVPRPASSASPGQSMVEVHKLIERAAPTLINVLLLGETGVGKDVAAERLHQRSTRAGGPLLRINCAGLSATLLESELFGHERGAFTGAAQTKVGLLEAAAGGTVLLDEIGEMPLEVQAKLLLAIEQRVVRRVGGTRSEPIDVRFVAATHRDLEDEIRRGRFRADFFYRINGLSIRIPPLRERGDELPALIALFAGEAAARLGRPRAPRFDEDALTRLERHRWPGNVRELRSVVERAVLLADGDTVTPGVLISSGLDDRDADTGGPAAITSAAPLAEASEPDAAVTQRIPTLPEDGADGVELAERQRVIAALAACGGNQSRAARMLGVSRNTLIARIRRYGLARPHQQGDLG